MEIAAYLIGLLFMLVGLAISIALHEFGHLIPAKLFRVRVGEYMIGFGPTLWSRKIGDTEYGVKALPIGGFISMAGMYPPSGDEAKPTRRMFASMVQEARAASAATIAEGAEDRVFYKLPVYKRIIIMLGGPIMNLLLAIVIFSVLVSGIGVERGTTTVAGVSQCVVAASEQRDACEPGDQPAPAAQAGIVPGDRIVSIDGTPVSAFDDVLRIVQQSAGTQLSVVIERDGTQQTLALTPALTERPALTANGAPDRNPDGSPRYVQAGFIGVESQLARTQLPLSAGPTIAWENTAQVARVMLTLPQRMIDLTVDTVTGQGRDLDSPVGVLGVGRLAGEVATQEAPVLDRFATLLGLLGSLNIALFVFNLIPLLPLDGGHVAIALIDGIRRAWAQVFRRPPPRPIDGASLVPLTLAVAAVFIVMTVLLLFADFVNPLQLFVE